MRSQLLGYENYYSVGVIRNCEMLYVNTTINQTLTLSSASAELVRSVIHAEYNLSDHINQSGEHN